MQILPNAHIDLHIYKYSNSSNDYSNAVQLNQMILKKTHHLKLSTSEYRIRRFWPAFNDSIVI
jgi:hypothetical protein